MTQVDLDTWNAVDVSLRLADIGVDVAGGVIAELRAAVPGGGIATVSAFCRPLREALTVR